MDSDSDQNHPQTELKKEEEEPKPEPKTPTIKWETIYLEPEQPVNVSYHGWWDHLPKY